ncbi:F0F1 ATP synthase subunit A [Gimesia algae]|uniref:ATP synthase subunit a n=1 Tax=Gimesia algae TaxID=2527971 RepID=A0A517VAD7_9PLAN|nr:F0F1 ATP synthase subunit A [Gimesia algae]QDT89967.1 ATP synthase subunit a [Gimesia algae]
MNMSPDEPLWQWEFLILNRTILFTWLIMGLLTCGSWLVTRRLSTSARLSRGQNLLEVLVSGLKNQIQDVSQQDPGPFLPFVGTLFLFIVVSNILSIVPGYEAPTSSLSTTAALATCVFIAVPIYGIASQGLADYLKQYLQPSFLMLPFNIIGELSRTLALAVRLYGNIMSGGVIGAILLGFVPLFVPILMQAFGLLTGVIQAYIFAVLAMVYIASGTQATHTLSEQPEENSKPNT